MKERLSGDGVSVGSPDIADALACTFFQPVAPAKVAHGGSQSAIGLTAVTEYDPLEA